MFSCHYEVGSHHLVRRLLAHARTVSRLGAATSESCYGNLGPPKILVLGTKFSGKISPGGPILPDNVDPCPKILVLPLLAPARSLHVSNQGVVKSPESC